MSNLIEVKVPDIGDFKNIPVIEVLVKPGDKVNKEDGLITLESDKATMEVPAPHAGIVKDLRIKVGDKVSQGSLILALEGLPGETVAAKPATPASKAEMPAAITMATTLSPESPSTRAASPRNSALLRVSNALRAKATPRVSSSSTPWPP